MTAVAPQPEPLTLEQHLAVPYVLVVYSVAGSDGTWVRRAEYPELGDCVVDAPTAREAIERLELRRVQLIRDRFARGGALKAPRPPLQRGVLPSTIDLRVTAR